MRFPEWSGSVSPAHIHATRAGVSIEAIRDLPQSLQASSTCRCSPAHPGFSAQCGGATRARNISTWSHGFASRFPASRCRPTSSSGFPGETTADFDDTLSLTEAAQYHSMFSFKYSPRPNTLASRRMPDDVSAEDKTARIVALQGLQRSIQTRLHLQAIGTKVDVLIDSVSRRRAQELSGRTSGNTVVDLAMPSDTSGIATDWIGRTVTVRVTRAGPHSLSGDAMSWAAQARRQGHAD